MICGAVDVGTNSVRLLIAEVEKNRVRRVHFEMETTRIGAGTAAVRELGEEGMARTLEALSRFRSVMMERGVEKVRAVATSAVRETVNGQEFARRAAEVLGFPLEIISGEEEAYLGYLGAARGLPQVKRPLVLDIGGGSSELVWMEGQEVKAYSLPVGAVGLTEDPGRIQIVEDWDWLFKKLAGMPELTLVGVGGTTTTLAAVELKMEQYDPDRVQGYEMAIESVERIFDCLASLSLEERRRVKGLQPERADIITAGTRILLEVMRRSGKKKLVVAESDLLYGIVQGAFGI